MGDTTGATAALGLQVRSKGSHWENKPSLQVTEMEGASDLHLFPSPMIAFFFLIPHGCLSFKFSAKVLMDAGMSESKVRYG